jgi:glycosyltransferase involved in cell wall biosynthesis
MHTPMRYAWDDCQRYAQEFHFPSLLKKWIPFAMNPIRIWDKASADRPDFIVANSTFVADRIRKYYRRESTVIHPPVSIENFFVSEERDDYFLMVGRLIAYKKHDIVIRAFNDLHLPLKIIGRGPELSRLKKIAGPTIEFLDRVGDKDLSRYYARCQAFLFPQEEDFGIVAIEALASGRPVLAYRGGDIPRHIIEGETGLFFDEQTKAGVMATVQSFQKKIFDPQRIRQSSLAFDKKIFQEKMREYILGKI